MRKDTNPEGLWRYTVLLSKIIDARFKWAEVEGETPNSFIKRASSARYDPIRIRVH